jgi:hypothetical protein
LDKSEDQVIYLEMHEWTSTIMAEKHEVGSPPRNTKGSMVTRSPSIAEINSDFSLRYPYVPIPQPSIPEAHDQQNPPPSSPSLALTAYPTPTASEAIQALSLFARKHKAVVDLDKGSNKDSAQTRDPISVAQIEAEYQRDISGRQACDLVPDGAFRGGSWH